MIGIILIVMIK